MIYNKINTLGKLAFIILSIAISSCATNSGGSTENGGDSKTTNSSAFDDQSLEHSVNNVLSAQVPNGSFTVASDHQNVLLAGQVPTQEDKDKAELAVSNTAGVKKVWNYLTISVNETIGDISHDTYLTSLAKSRLIAQKGVNANSIKVVTCKDVVYLLGDQSAGNPVQINGAVQGIESISGVKKVVNLIQKDPSKKKYKASAAK